MNKTEDIHEETINMSKSGEISQHKSSRASNDFGTDNMLPRTMIMSPSGTKRRTLASPSPGSNNPSFTTSKDKNGKDQSMDISNDS